tara:strand:- start:392 stop:616 length:225 start_codon:yes stop_codon:yes gene_type:complete
MPNNKSAITNSSITTAHCPLPLPTELCISTFAFQTPNRKPQTANRKQKTANCQLRLLTATAHCHCQMNSVFQKT